MGIIHEIDSKENPLEDGQKIAVVDNGLSTKTYFGYPRKSWWSTHNARGG